MLRLVLAPTLALVSLITAMSWSSFSFATNVTPTEKLGRLKIVADLKDTPDARGVLIQFAVGSSATKIGFDRENVVAAGEGCLSITQSNFIASQCGVLIQEKQLTTINLAVLKLRWDPNLLNVDFGPIPAFNLSTKDLNRKLSGKLEPSSPDDQGKFLLMPAMNVAVSLEHKDTGVLYSQTISVAEGSSLVENLKLPDLRGTLFLDFIDGAPKFQVPSDTYAMVVYRQDTPAPRTAHAPTYYRDAGPGRSGGYLSTSVGNAYVLDRRGASQKLRAFPLDVNAQKARYELTVNEHVIYPRLTSGQQFHAPIATLNVSHYKSSIAGTFRVLSNQGDPLKYSEILFPRYGSNTSFDTHEFVTQTSLFFPVGFKYRLDFYAIDDLGRQSLQDQVEVDLTK